MIEEQYSFSDFASAPPFGPSLTAQIAAAALPALVCVSTLGQEVFLRLDSVAPLTAGQQATLDAIVALHDGVADELQAQKDAYDLLVDNHADTLLQVAGLTPLQVQLNRDAVKTSIAAAVDESTARAITEAYIQEDIPS